MKLIKKECTNPRKLVKHMISGEMGYLLSETASGDWHRAHSRSSNPLVMKCGNIIVEILYPDNIWDNLINEMYVIPVDEVLHFEYDPKNFQ